jgi:hypothetical protein
VEVRTLEQNIPSLFVGKAFDMLYGDAGNVASMTVAKRNGEWH